ncbi:MAG: hypothetical protein PHR68_00870 [Candidatus Gracilibacteria bacterium]|nr:hypothetical protein [Candidatus Gracilibacteria bacterium]
MGNNKGESIKINLEELSKDIHKVDEIALLGSEEKETFKRFLMNKNEKNKKGILYISSSEIDNLKKAIQQNKLNEFINLQNEKSISSSEILSGSELEKNLGGKENLKNMTLIVEKAVYSYLFDSKDSPFYGIKLSDDAKNNIVTGFNFFLFDYIYNKAEIIGISDIIGKITGKIDELLKGNFDVLKELGNDSSKIMDNFKDIKQIFTLLNININSVKDALKGTEIKNDGESNKIFMNPFESKKFFEKLSNGEIQDIKNYINDGETGNNVNVSKHDLEELKKGREKWTKYITKENGGKLSSILTIGNVVKDFKGTIQNVLKSTPGLIEGLQFVENIPILGDLLKMFLGFLGIKNLDDFLNEINFSDIKENIKKVIQEKDLIVSELKIGNDFMKIGNDDDLNLLKNLRIISGNKNEKYHETIKNILKKGSEFDSFSKKISFISGSFEDKGNLIYTNLSSQIGLYADFIEKRKENKGLNIDNYVENKQKKDRDNVKTILPNNESPTKISNEIESEEKINSVNESNINLNLNINNKYYNINWDKNGEIIIKSDEKSIKFKVSDNSTFEKALLINKLTSLKKEPNILLKPMKELADSFIDSNGILKENDINYKDKNGTEIIFTFISSNNKQEFKKDNPIKNSLKEEFDENIKRYKILEDKDGGQKLFELQVTNDGIIVECGNRKYKSDISFYIDYFIEKGLNPSKSKIIKKGDDYILLLPEGTEIKLNDLYNKMKNGGNNFELKNGYKSILNNLILKIV